MRVSSTYSVKTSVSANQKSSSTTARRGAWATASIRLRCSVLRNAQRAAADTFFGGCLSEGGPGVRGCRGAGRWEAPASSSACSRSSRQLSSSISCSDLHCKGLTMKSRAPSGPSSRSDINLWSMDSSSFLSSTVSANRRLLSYVWAIHKQMKDNRRSQSTGNCRSVNQQYRFTIKKLNETTWTTTFQFLVQLCHLRLSLGLPRPTKRYKVSIHRHSQFYTYCRLFFTQYSRTWDVFSDDIDSDARTLS